MFKRNQRRSDTDLRERRSLDAIRMLAYGRYSELNARHCQPPTTPSSSADDVPLALQRNITKESNHSSSKPRHTRFSFLRFKNASDPALGYKTREESPPPLPKNFPVPPPSIVTTSPADDITIATPASLTRTGTMRLWHTEKQSKPTSRISTSAPSSVRSSLSTRKLQSEHTSRSSSRGRLSRVTFDEPERLHPSSSSSTEPPPYDEQTSSLPLPGPRLSESSRSTASSGDQTIGYSTTTTTHTTTTTTFFRMPRRKKKDAPLFPLPGKTSDTNAGELHSGSDATLNNRRHSIVSNQSSGNSFIITQNDQTDRPVSTILAASALNFTGPGVPILHSSSISANPTCSSPSSSARRTTSLRGRGRSSTMSSIEQGPTRNKSSLVGLFGRLRRDSEPIFKATGLSRPSSPQPQLAFSAPGSRATSREIFIPERNDEDTPPVYLSKLLGAVSKSVVASLLARNGDLFHHEVLTAYMRTFDFENDPMDMSLRKLLMEVELPSETQQIDRVLQAFAERYHDCNPFVYQNPDQAYFIAFSLIMLHTDYFNKNNKHKMQKADYIKNTTGSITQNGISNDILECFYANIIYTPFIRMEDEYDINGEKIPPHRPKKGIFHRTINAYDGRRMKEPIDPYLLIIDGQLGLLRPNLKDLIPFEDPYSYSGTASRLNISALHKAFFRSGVLQIVSARSRPDAFMNQATVDNPEGADPGVVEIKVTKVGILWRKEVKRKKTRSPWHEWGAILTGSQLYFFRNVGWVKSLMSQYEQHHRHGSGTPVIFKPPLEQFKPDTQISTDDAVALLDKSYKKHKNAFAFIRHGGVQEYFIADSEVEMNDWLAKLNYAATFRTAGVRMRGVLGGGYEIQRLRSLRCVEGNIESLSSNSVQTPSGEVSIVRGNIDSKLAAEISAARREVVEQRIHESEDHIAIANTELQSYLRNGRHLTILAPIQPRNREQVMMAAATLAAKLRWVRMEMWKLRCHRDILALDMEEERLAMKERERNELSLGSSTQQTSTFVAPLPPFSNSPMGRVLGGDNFTTTQATPTEDTQRRPSHSSLEILQDRNKQAIPLTAPQSPSHMFKADNYFVSADDRSFDTAKSYRSPTPTISDSSFAASLDGDDEKEKERSKEKSKGKEKEKESSRPNIRKSFQRTLRESQSLGHKKNKSSNEDATIPDKAIMIEEGLARRSGSFTVHGKKASVITFGSEWQNISSDDHLRRKKGYTNSDGDVSGETASISSILSLSRRGSAQVAQPPTKSDDSVHVPVQIFGQ